MQDDTKRVQVQAFTPGLSNDSVVLPAAERQAAAASLTYKIQQQRLKEQAAATCIQAAWRAYAAQHAWRRVQLATGVIQRSVRRWQLKKTFELFQANQPAHVWMLLAKSYKDKSLVKVRSSLPVHSQNL